MPDSAANPEQPEQSSANSVEGDSAPAGPPSESSDSELSNADDHTVLSEGPILAPDRAYAGLRPRDLGKALAGQQLGSVYLEEYVGGGGMGAVFRGRDVSLQRTVAVKVLATHNANGDDTARRFAIEAQSGAQFDHPNIARIHHSGQDHGLQYIVFEYIDGPNLRDLVAQQGPQPISAVVRHAIQLADALAHASKLKIVHRDIKPSNILITDSGQAKLVDMGLARMDQTDQPYAELTATGTTLGTFDYIAPEQARDPREADIRSDIYSLGCTLFFLLTGKPPFPDGTAAQKLLRHQDDQPPDIRTERPDAPLALIATIERMLAKHPDQRHQTAEQLLGELLLIAKTLDISAPTISVVAPAALPTAVEEGWLRRNSPWLVAVGLLIAIGTILPSVWGPSEASPGFEPLKPAIDEPTEAPIAEDEASLEQR